MAALNFNIELLSDRMGASWVHDIGESDGLNGSGSTFNVWCALCTHTHDSHECCGMRIFG
jgi:hypothetical protein